MWNLGKTDYFFGCLVAVSEALTGFEQALKKLIFFNKQVELLYFFIMWKSIQTLDLAFPGLLFYDL